MPIYHKLIRDNIIDIINKDGKKCHYRVLQNEEFFEELRKKLYEELQEYDMATTNKQKVEELVDMMEIIYTLSNIHGYSMGKLEKLRRDKVIKNGGFSKKLFLIDVMD